MIGNKMIFVTLLVVTISQMQHVSAQHMSVGAEAAGTGFANVALKGRMGVWGNAAALYGLSTPQILVGYENRYGISEGLHSISAAYLHPLKSSALAVSFYRFGDELYSQHKVSLAMGHQISQFAAGLRLNQYQFHTEGTDTRYATTVDFGGMAQLLPELAFGMQLTNINQARVSRETGERIPTILSLGFRYEPDKKLTILSELAYDLDKRPQLKAGMAYQPLKNITFRSGFNTGTEGRLFLGMGLEHSVIIIDYALETHAVLGISQHVGMAYKLRKHGS